MDLIWVLYITGFIAFCITIGKDRSWFIGIFLALCGPVGMVASFFLEDRSTIKCEECKSKIPHDAKVCKECGWKVVKK